MNLIYFLFILSWVLIGEILILLNRKVIIYDEKTKEVIAVINIKRNSKQILHKKYNIAMKEFEVNLIGKEGKIYIDE